MKAPFYLSPSLSLSLSRATALLIVAVAAGAPAGCASPSGGSPSGTGGTGNSSGTGGTGPVMCGPQDQPPAANGANFPFPQHRLAASCGYPTSCNDADVMTSWNTYKGKMIVMNGGGLRVQRPENSNDTVSEGIAYGMVFAVYMTDKTTFDGLWAYAKARRNGNGLMNWHYDSSGNMANAGAATDADEDMAFALIMADKQWGGYQGDASALVNAILSHEVDASNMLHPDDSGGTADENPSYFAPAYYRVFQSYTGQSRWSQVVDSVYTVLNKCANATTGLVPDWCTPSSGAAARNSHYGYDATRTPFRIAQDACWNNESRAVTYLAKVSGFFNKVGPTGIVDGYNLDGTVAGQYVSPAFEGPAGVSAMPSGQTDADFMRQIYTRTAVVAKAGSSSAYNYYNGSWALMTLMLMTGNLTPF
jgi:endo-1,4-beta-D-glucanase Y